MKNSRFIFIVAAASLGFSAESMESTPVAHHVQETTTDKLPATSYADSEQPKVRLSDICEHTYPALCDAESSPREEQRTIIIGGQLVNKDVTEFDLSDMMLESVPLEITHLKNLTILILFYNQLTIIPSEICQLSKLEKLYLSSNHLTSTPSSIPHGISQLTNLHSLYLNNNRLTEFPNEICQVPSLRYITLSSNQIQITSFPGALSQLTNLECLEMTTNNLTTIPDELFLLPKLDTLWLPNNKITCIGSSISQLTNLTKVSLSKNQLTTLPSTIGELTKLQRLYLESNQIVRIPDELVNCFSLSDLRLNNNKLRSIPIFVLLNLRNIFEVNLSGNPLKGFYQNYAKDIRPRNNHDFKSLYHAEVCTFLLIMESNDSTSIFSELPKELIAKIASNIG